MNDGPAQSRRSIRTAGAGLRRAVHDLAEASITRTPDVQALERAAALVREATAQLDGDVLASREAGPPAPHEAHHLGSYTIRSLFQGELHPFSPSLTWEDIEGPGGEPGYGFRVQLSSLYEGPPGSLHGGYLAGLFDELLGGVQGLADGGPGYTGRLTVRYRALTPLGAELEFRGWVVADKGRRIHTAGRCRADGVLCADAEALFVRSSAGGDR